jgi:hypothetical protein
VRPARGKRVGFGSILFPFFLFPSLEVQRREGKKEAVAFKLPNWPLPTFPTVQAPFYRPPTVIQSGSFDRVEALHARNGS